jgi:hypothetical protein
MMVARNLSTGQNAERPGGNRGELKLNQSAPWTVQPESGDSPHFAQPLGRIKGDCA